MESPALACPFCGGPASVYRDEAIEEWFAECNTCRSSDIGVPLTFFAGPCSTRDDAVNAWNRRPPITSVMAIQSLWELHSNWSQSTFGTDQERGPIGAFRHLKLECDEAIDAVNNPLHSFTEETADCFLLLLDAARRGGLTLDALVNAAARKLEICKTRTYEKTPEGVPSLHKKGGGS